MVDEVEDLRRQLREARDAAEATAHTKEAFLANMSHELRTPLTVVIGAAELLLETEHTPEQHESLEAIRRSGKLLLGLISDILDYSKIGSGKLELVAKHFDLWSALREVVDAFSSGARDKGISLELQVEGDVPRWVRADPLRIKQILMNLLSNAVRHTSEGGIRVVASTDQADESSARVRIVVEDTGSGISREVLPQLFQPFTQGKRSGPGGTGLGLAICKNLAQLMGGDLGVSSTRGVGSQFWFSLNVQLTRQSAVMRAISAPPPLDPELPPARILVAEDNVFTQVLMRRTLESMGHTVDVVGRGDEALKLTKKREYDAILLDCQMPVMDGYETARRIRQRDESTPIIAVTANAVVGDRDKCLAASMNDYVSKPFSIHDVRRVLAKWLGPTPVSEAPPSAPRATSDSHVDLERFRDVTASTRPEFAHELVAIFCLDMDHRLQELAASHARSNATEVHRLAHTIKGASANIGARRMSELAMALQEADATGEAARELIAQLGQELDRVRTVLCSEVDPTGS